MGRNRFVFSAILLIAISFLYGGTTKEVFAQNNTTICKGVFIDQVDVSQMTGDQARAAVGEYIESLRNKRVAVMVDNNIVQTDLKNLGYTTDYADAVKQALRFGRSGNLIKRYKELKDIEQGNVVLPLTYTFSTKKIKEWVGTNVSAYNIAPVNASIRRENGAFKYTDEIIGSKVNIEQTAQIVSEAINNWIRQDIIVEAAMEEDLPLYTRANVELCDTVLGSFTTDYSSSAAGRASNLANGARLINNLVLYPGDVFSAYKVLTPFTEENGYYIAGAYLNGQVVDSVGGGACQVTTTLYNAVLAAELEVVERMPHSMTISYVDLSRDAAIAGTYKDFKFKNSTDAPIVIESTTRNRKISFKIWGHETRDTKNRRVEYETKIVSKTNPPADKITEDPTKPKTYRKVTQSAHTGYKAQLYKIVFENNVEVSRTLVNTSTYKAEPQYVTIGTKEEEETPKVPDTTNNNTDKNNSQKHENTTDTNSTNSETQASPEDEPLEWDPSWDIEEPVQ
jgi:vancomycin resistance protein YoaR